MTSTEPRRRFVTEIPTDLNPKLEDYFDKLLRFLPMQARQVHESSMYEPLVVQTEAYNLIGVFYIFLIRKEIFNLMGEEATDLRASKMEKYLESDRRLSSDNESDPVTNGAHDQPETDETEFPVGTEKLPKAVSRNGDDEHENDEKNERTGIEELPVPSKDDNEEEACSMDTKKSPKYAAGDADDESEDYEVDIEQLEKLVDSYQKFKDPKNATLDIIEDIFNTAMLRQRFHSNSIMSFDPKLVNMNNIRRVLEYAGTFDRTNILLNPIVHCQYFRGMPNLIVDDTIVLINTSKHFFRVNHTRCRRHMYQLILYALGVYVREGKEIRKFKIYNPLLGFEYFFEIPHLDFPEFVELVEEIKPL